MLRPSVAYQSSPARTARLDQAGQATIELALSLGLLLMLMTAALDFGRAFFDYIALINAAREGARAGVIMQSAAQIEPAVRQELQNSTVNLGRLTVQHTWGGSGQPLVVTVRYTFLPIVTAFLPFSQINMSTSAAMIIP